MHNYYLCVLGRVPISEKKETVSNYNGDGSEKDAKIQIEFAFCQTLFKLIASFKPAPGDFCWSWIPKGCIQKQKENLSCLYILHKILHKEFPSHSGPVDIKEMHNTAWCTCRAVLLLIKPSIFWSYHCCHHCGFLSSLIFSLLQTDRVADYTIEQINIQDKYLWAAKNPPNVGLCLFSSLYIKKCNLLIRLIWRNHL